MKPIQLSWGVAVAFLAVAGHASADPEAPSPPVVVEYDAPPDCPSGEAFAAAVRTELAGRTWDRTQPVQARVVVTAGEGAYSARIASTGSGGAALERTVTAPTCDEVTDVAAAVVALAQVDAHAPDVVVTRPPPPSAPPARPPPPARPAAPPSPPPRDLSYAVMIGYGAFTHGPADPVVRGGGEETTFNAAQGVRLGFEVAHTIGWWKHSLDLSAAYYRQSTTTVAAPTVVGTSLVPSSSNVSIEDRDVLLATIDACPIHLEYEFMSLIPCATVSMMQSRGNSGNSPGLETGFGGSARLRGRYAWFLAEAMGTVVAVSSSYEPPSHSVRGFYALSVGVIF